MDKLRKLCKICGEGQDVDRLISPCGCTGPSENVHEACLRLWILARCHDLAKAKCEECGVLFDMEIRLGQTVSCAWCTDSRSAKWASVLVSVLVLGALGLYILEAVAVNQTDPTAKVNMWSIFSALATIYAVIVGVSVLYASKKFLVESVAEWQIFDQ